MYSDLYLTLSVSQREEVKKKVISGEIWAWIADAVCDLIEQDKKKRLKLSHFRPVRENNLSRPIKCFFTPKEIELLKSIVSRLKYERRGFSRAWLVEEAIRRKLDKKEKKSPPLTSPMEILSMRVTPEVRSWIRKVCFERRKRKAYLLTDWFTQAVQEFLDSPFPIGLQKPHEKTKDTVKMIFQVPSEFLKKIKDIVSEAKKTYPMFSVSSFLAEVSRRKFEKKVES